MGTVHAALDPGGRRVAVKVVHPAQAGDEEFRARFKREVEVSRRVTGPCLVALLAADPGAAVPWLATPYVPGLTLGAHIAAHGPLSGPGCTRWRSAPRPCWRPSTQSGWCTAM
jgi:serine/threonine protein kinase